MSAIVRLLPDQFQSKLNLARRGLCGGDQPGAGDGISSLIEHGKVRSRRRKIGPVQEVEKLGAELDIEIFRKAPDIVVLED